MAQRNYQQENGQDENGVVLCIPRVFSNIKASRVKRHMIAAGLGWVERVDLVPTKQEFTNKAGKSFRLNRAYVYMKPNSWPEEKQEFLEALNDGQMIQIEYEEPWFWLVGISSSKRMTMEERLQRREEAMRAKAKVSVSIRKKSTASSAAAYNAELYKKQVRQQEYNAKRRYARNAVLSPTTPPSSPSSTGSDRHPDSNSSDSSSNISYGRKKQ